MRILSIETSCDETSIAIVDYSNPNKQARESIFIHAHLTASQASMHAEYGGVFPAVAKREHVIAMVPLLSAVFKQAKLTPNLEVGLPSEKELEVRQILERDPELAENLIEYVKENGLPKFDVISVTSGPGLEIALWVGITTARALSCITGAPLMGINHMLGHLYSPLLPETTIQKEIILRDLPSNALALLVSGGHTEIVHIENNKYSILGETLDDAVGEAYDKVARLMGLSYPGGPLVSRLADTARAQNIKPVDLPRPMIHSGDYNFSYSGLKTAVMYYLRDNPMENDTHKMAMALGFENAAIEVLIKKIQKAIHETNANTVLLGGGVSANNHLQKELQNLSTKENVQIILPDSGITGDNALMIALATIYKIKDTGIANDFKTIKADGMMTIA